MDDLSAPTADVFSYSDYEPDLAFNATAPAYGVLSPLMSKVINILLIVVLFITMVSMGCTMEVAKIKQNILKPKGVAIAALAQYGVMPLTAFSLTQAFSLDDITSVTVLICGCCPGGALSNILALALKGDMNLSIVMTTCSTALALGMMPLLLFLYCQNFPNLHRLVPYTQIVTSLVLILVPCGAGILINHYRPKYSRFFLKLGIGTLMSAVVVVCVLITVDIGGSFLTVLAPPLLAISVIMPLVGYAFGYIISSIFRLSHSQRRTVAMETGCQNIQLCSTILKVAFPPATIGALFLFPMVFASFQLMEAAVLIVLFRLYQRFGGRREEIEPPPPAGEETAKEPLKAVESA